jgi:hypothetical protein
LLACVFDEVSYWRDELSALPDVETYRAVLPALSTTNGLLVCISSPYRRSGLMFAKHRDHFGQDDDEVLVVQGRTALFNPTIDASVIARAIASDPEAARAEWEAEFRSDLSAFQDDATIDRAIDYDRPLELPPRKDVAFHAACDSSGGRHDAFSICIGSKQGDRYVCDAIRGAHPPFDPQAVVAEFAALLKDYGIDRIVGDNYSAAWNETAWTENGIKYEKAELNKSALYLEALPLFMRGAVSIPDHPRLIRELQLLERKASRLGRDIVDHPKNSTDDYSNSLCLCLYAMTAKRSSFDSSYRWAVAGGPEDPTSPNYVPPEKRQRSLWEHSAMFGGFYPCR